MDAEVGLIDFKDYARTEAKRAAEQLGIDTSDDVDSAWDAFRHAYTSALATAWYGETTARLIGDWNEIWGSLTGQGENQLNQDLWNNAVGRTIGRDSVSKLDIANRVFQSLQRGELIISANTDLRRFLPVTWHLATEYGMSSEDAIYTPENHSPFLGLDLFPPEPDPSKPTENYPDDAKWESFYDPSTGTHYSFVYDSSGNLIDQAVGNEQGNGSVFWEVYSTDGDFLWEYTTNYTTWSGDEGSYSVQFDPNQSLEESEIDRLTAAQPIRSKRLVLPEGGGGRFATQHFRVQVEIHSVVELKSAEPNLDARRQITVGTEALIQACSLFTAATPGMAACLNPNTASTREAAYDLAVGSAFPQ